MKTKMETKREKKGKTRKKLLPFISMVLRASGLSIYCGFLDIAGICLILNLPGNFCLLQYSTVFLN